MSHTPAESPDSLIARLTAEHLARSESNHRDLHYYLSLAEIAIPAILSAAQAGNIQCKAAVLLMSQIKK